MNPELAFEPAVAEFLAICQHGIPATCGFYYYTFQSSSVLNSFNSANVFYNLPAAF
jgi:hypothetical protein